MQTCRVGTDVDAEIQPTFVFPGDLIFFFALLEGQLERGAATQYFPARKPPPPLRLTASSGDDDDDDGDVANCDCGWLWALFFNWRQGTSVSGIAQSVRAVYWEDMHGRCNAHAGQPGGLLRGRYPHQYKPAIVQW